MMSHINQGAARYSTADVQGTRGWQERFRAGPFSPHLFDIAHKIKPREAAVTRGQVLQGVCALGGFGDIQGVPALCWEHLHPLRVDSLKPEIQRRGKGQKNSRNNKTSFLLLESRVEWQRLEKG